MNIAVLQGDEIKIIDPQAAADPTHPTLLASLFRLEAPVATGTPVNVLLELAVSIRAHGRGGTLLVVPTGSGAWTESILQPITYSVAPAFSRLADLMRKNAGNKPSRRWEDALGRAVDGIAGLTAVDGASSDDLGIRVAGIRGQDCTPQGISASGPRNRHGTYRRRESRDRRTGPVRRHPPLVSGTVCSRSARRDRTRGIAGRQIHGLRLVPPRRNGARSQNRCAFAVVPGPFAPGSLRWLRGFSLGFRFWECEHVDHVLACDVVNLGRQAVPAVSGDDGDILATGHR